MGKRARKGGMSARELYIGADLHERETQLAIFEKDGRLLLEKRLPTSDLSRFISTLPGTKHIGAESVGFIYPIYDQLSGVKDCDVSVCNPNTIRERAKTKIKNDRVDAKTLGDLLRTNYFPKSHIPDEETREERLLTKERVTYGTRQAELKNSVKWMLKRRGVEVKKPFSKKGMEQLHALHLPEIDHRLKEFELIGSIVDELDGRIRAMASKDEKAKLLDTIPGLGAYTALFLASALDDVSRFKDSKQACAYVGLVPSLHQSGDVSYTGHVTRLGNKWLRRNLVECARWSVKKDTHIGEFFLRIARKKGTKKAYVAVARKLVAYAYWMLKGNVTYQELAPWKTDRGQSS